MIKVNNTLIQITDVLPVTQAGNIQYYTTRISIRELADMYDKLVYDGDAQRGCVKGKPMIDKKHVKQIYNNIINGDLVSGNLIWNIRNDENSNWTYKEDGKRLLIHKDQMITIPDSAHRHKALKMVFDKVKEGEILDSEFTLTIYNLSKDQEKDLFYTINGKGKAPNKNRIKYLSNETECKLLRDVIDKSELKDRIECVKDKAYLDGYLTKFSTLYESLFGKTEGVFNPNDVNNDNYEEYLNWLIEFYNELLNSIPEFKFKTLEEKQKIKQTSMSIEELAWWGYAYLAKELKGQRNWKKTLHKKMNTKVTDQGKQLHFMNKSVPIWHATVIKPKYNFITKTQEAGTSVTNSNATRASVKKVFALTL